MQGRKNFQQNLDFKIYFNLVLYFICKQGIVP